MEWEYRFEVVELHDHDTSAAVEVLDRFGGQAWEAVGFSPSEATSHGLRSVQTTRYLVLLKRPRGAG